MNKLQLKQAPIIEYDFLVEEGQKVTDKLEKLKLNELVITEDTVKGIKKVRTELKKEFEEYDAARKAIKEMVMKPYEDFNKSFEEHFKSKYSNADSTLKLSIDEVETGIKKGKENEVKEYFNEMIETLDKSFGQFKKMNIKFEQMNIKVGLSDSVKSLQEKVAMFLGGIKTDLETIETLENSDRVLAKYHQTLNLSTSIIQVNNDIKSEKEIENARIEREKVAQAVAKVEVIETPKEVIEVQEVVEEELITLSFKVTGTRSQIIKVREFMKVEGIKYE